MEFRKELLIRREDWGGYASTDERLEVRSHRDKRGADLISDVLPFGLVVIRRTECGQPFLRLNRNEAGLATQAGSPTRLNVREIRAFREHTDETQARSPPVFAAIVSDDLPILQGCQLVRNHRASHSVVDGGHHKPNGYPHKVTGAHHSDGF